MGVAHGTAKVRIRITTFILARMRPLRCPPASTQRVNVDKMVAWKNEKLEVEIMRFEAAMDF